MAHNEQTDRLDGLKSHERPACLIAERVLGVVAHALDLPGAGPRCVDATLHYPDGRRAAFEVLRLAERADLHLDARLRDERYVWTVPGATGIWTLVVPSVERLTGLRGLVERAVRACEAASVRDPFHLPWEVIRGDEELRVLAEEGAAQLYGHGIPAPDGQGRVVLTPGAVGMFVSETALQRLDVELAAAFLDDQQVPRHFDKLRDCPDVQERHLFLRIDYRRLAGGTYDSLAFSEQMPALAPPVPEHLTHLWLHPAYGSRVLLWSRSSGWSSHALPQ